MGAVTILGLVLKFAPIVNAIVDGIEAMVTQSKSGSIKKQRAVDTLNTLVDGTQQGLIAAGSSDEANVISLIKPLLPQMVDDAVAEANRIGKWTVGHDVVDTTPDPTFGPEKAGV